MSTMIAFALGDLTLNMVILTFALGDLTLNMVILTSAPFVGLEAILLNIVESMSMSH